jgi:hypothetical protein
LNKQAAEARSFKRSFGDQIRQAQLERQPVKQKLAAAAVKIARL